MSETDKVFYSLSEDDILEVANELDIKLTPDEMARAKKGFEDAFGSGWHDILETVLDEIIEERRQADDGHEAGHRR